MSRVFVIASITLLSLLALSALTSVDVKGQQPDEEPPLPTTIPEVDIVAEENKSYVLSVVDFGGPKAAGTEAAAVIRRNFQLMPGYRVRTPETLPHSPYKNGIEFKNSGWAKAGIDGVAKGVVEQTSPNNLVVVARYFRVGAKSNPLFERRYSGEPKLLRKWMHAFSNDILKALTGRPGVFDRKVTYARREAPGRKNIYCAEMNGHSPLRITKSGGLALLPTFDANKRVWFTRLTERGMYISRTGLKGRPVISGNGLNMAPAVCHGRVFFTSSRDGNSEIYSSNEEGGDIKRLTKHPAIDVSPACGPNGRIAFVSARHGSPQIFVMDANGRNQKRITYKGGHNQTPNWCQDPSNPDLIAFTGRDGGLDVFTVNIKTQEYTRITQGQGTNKDPSFSPDCRMLSFVSDRRGAPGIYMSSLSGFNQTRIVEGDVETVHFQP